MTHFIFDFDGTLVDTDGLFSKCLSHALEPFDVKVSKNFMEEIRHKHPHRIFEDLLPRKLADEAMERMRTIGKNLSQRINAFDGIEDTLESLANRNIQLSIWTGRDGESAQRILKNIGLNHYFDKIVSGTCVPVNKPGLDGLQTLASHYKVKHDRFVMVGDHHHDIEPANEVGAISVLAKWKPIPQLLPADLSPDHEFDCVHRFRDWTESLPNK